MEPYVPEMTIVDYGVGNLHSISKALTRCGARVRTTRSLEEMLDAACLVFPGVGAFSPASDALSTGRGALASRIREGLPTLGICLGMQILCEGSEEGKGDGLGLIPGSARRLHAGKLPHIGWNRVYSMNDPVFDGIPEGTYFYFVHSYVVPGGGYVRALASYSGKEFAAAVRVGNALGLQFHPEKSSSAGLRLLKNFVAECGAM